MSLENPLFYLQGKRIKEFKIRCSRGQVVTVAKSRKINLLFQAILCQLATLVQRQNQEHK